jgi:catechol 2,3-dioxygenase-like lactoylglutathione lyase family enzyme
MLGDKAVAAVMPVKDMDVAKKFYEETLGLAKEGPDQPWGTMYRCGGGSMIFVYPSEFAGTNKATAATWGAGDDFDKIVDELRAKGVTFDKFDVPGASWEGDVNVMGDMKAVWFKDPDGNILNVVNQM